MVRRLVSVAGVNLLAKAVAFGAGVWIVRVLTPQEYAWFSHAQAVYSLVAAHIFSAINLELVRAYGAAVGQGRTQPERAQLLREFGLLTVLCYLPILLIGTFLAQPLAQALFRDAAFASPLRWGVWAGVGMVLGNLGLYTQQAQEQYRAYNWQNFLRHVLLLPGLLLVFALGWQDHVGAMLVFLLAQLLPSLVYFATPANRANLALNGIHWRLAVGHLRGLAPLIVYFSLWSLFDQLGVLLVSRSGDTIALAEYGLAARNYITLVLLMLSVQVVLLPRFARQTQADALLGNRQLLRRWWVFCLLVLVAGLIVSLFAEPAWVWLFGGYALAYRLFLVLLVGGWFLLAGTPAFSLLVSQRRYHILAWGAAMAIGALAVTAWIGGLDVWAIAVGNAMGVGIAYGWFTWHAWQPSAPQPPMSAS